MIIIMIIILGLKKDENLKKKSIFEKKKNSLILFCGDFCFPLDFLSPKFQHKKFVLQFQHKNYCT